MLIEPTSKAGTHLLWTYLAVISRQRKQLHPSDLLRRTALINVQMRGFCAEDCIKRTRQRTQCRDVSPGSIKNKERLGRGTKVSAHELFGIASIAIVAVGGTCPTLASISACKTSG